MFWFLSSENYRLQVRPNFQVGPGRKDLIVNSFGAGLLIVVVVPRQWWEDSYFNLRWRHNGCNGFSNHLLHDGILNRLFMRRSKKTPKLRVTGLCEGNSPVTGEFPSQRASNAENISIWWRHHATSWYRGHCVHSFVWSVIIHSCPNLNRFVKPTLKLGHEQVITSMV